jgi:hypothetical protein
MSPSPGRTPRSLAEVVDEEKRIYESGQREIRAGARRHNSSNLNQGLALIFVGIIAILYGLLYDIDAPIVIGVAVVLPGMLISWHFWRKFKTP